MRARVRLRLERAGYDVVEAGDGDDALRLAGERHPDLLVLDVAMSGRPVLDVCRAIQAHDPTAPPVILLTEEDDVHVVDELDGPVEHLVKPFAVTDLTARVRAVLRMKASRDAIASTDELTGILNRRGLETRAAEAVSLAQRHGRPLACLMLELDEFEKVGEELGPDAGEEVLQATAVRLLAVSRLSDVVGRYGGEEFTLLLPETEVAGAVAAGEKVREALEEHTVEANGREIRMGASVGVAVWAEEMNDAHDLFTAADRALYRARELGGNRVELDAGL